jgi:hypothetical protein
MSAMSARKKTRPPRITLPRAPATNWQAKVHPFFVRMVEYQNRVDTLLASPHDADHVEGQRLTDYPPPALMEEAQRLHDAIPAADRPRHDAHLSIYGAVDSKDGTVISLGQFMMGWLAWNKFGKSIVELVDGDDAGDEQSSRQLARVVDDYQAWRYGRLDPNKMRFKFDIQHIARMSAGLDLGLEALSPEELAECFDALCPCGKPHDPDNLRKLRTRVMKTMERLTRR